MAQTLADLAAIGPERLVVIARELSKLHEELLRGTAAELALAEREWQGEITIVLGPGEAAPGPKLDEGEIDARIDALLAQGLGAKDVARSLATETGRPQRELYARVHARKEKG